MQSKQHLNMTQFADHIIAVAHKNELPIINIHLQKIMYFTLKMAKQEPLIDQTVLKSMYNQHFRISRFGPMVSKQFSRFKSFSVAPIIGSFEQNPALDLLNPIIIELLQTKVFTLTELSLKEKFWIENHQKTDNYTKIIEYQFEDIWKGEHHVTNIIYH